MVRGGAGWVTPPCGLHGVGLVADADAWTEGSQPTGGDAIALTAMAGYDPRHDGRAGSRPRVCIATRPGTGYQSFFADAEGGHLLEPDMVCAGRWPR